MNKLTPGDIAAAAALHLQVPIAGVRAAMNSPTHPRDLRDDFAKAALTGMLASPDSYCCKDNEDFAKAAYRYADAMLEVRNANR